MTQPQTTSDRGIAFLERKEDVVLKAYRDVAGVLTIGAGLTKASGVIDPKPGMVISREEARALLRQALARNYEPRVRRAFPAGLQQHEFDAAVSFDFNTGAIDEASWVQAWKSGDVADAERRFKLWKKAGGRVLRGLVNRRAAEWTLLRHGDYGPEIAEAPQAPTSQLAGVTRTLDLEDVEQVAAGLAKLGYAPGDHERPARDAVEAFQRDHDLTVDGVIGPATLATLRRQRKAPQELANTAALAGAGGAVEVAAGQADALPVGAGLILACLAALGTLWLLWHYRDLVAARVQRVLPGLADWLRSR